MMVAEYFKGGYKNKATSSYGGWRLADLFIGQMAPSIAPDTKMGPQKKYPLFHIMQAFGMFWENSKIASVKVKIDKAPLNCYHSEK